MVKPYEKDPQANLDYQVDWSDWLGSTDTISTSTWTVPDGIVEESDSNTTTTATIWVSGGTLGETYDLVNHIVTTEGREDDRTIHLKLVDK